MNYIAGIRAALAIILLTLFFLIIQGCSTMQTGVAPPSKSDSVRINVVQLVDTVYRDRVHIEYLRGDTVVVRDSVWEHRYILRDRRDTICVRDSIPYPVEVVKEVRKRNGYDIFVSRGFWVYTALLLLMLVWKAVKLYLRR